MTIIVTGGAGFIGSNFIFHMLGKYPEYRIVCLDKLTYAGNLSTLKGVIDNPNFRFVRADICDREAVYKLFEEEHPDVVVNFAAESHVNVGAVGGSLCYRAAEQIVQRKVRDGAAGLYIQLVVVCIECYA